VTSDRSEFPSRAENGKTLKGDEVAMRTISKAFLSCVAVAAMGVLGPATTLANGHKYSCSSFNPSVTIVKGPCPVTGSPDHVATVVTANNTVVGPSGVQVYDACEGDPVTGLGHDSCHEIAIKVNPDTLTGDFWVVVDKSKAAVLQSVVAKKGSCVVPMAIAGLGYDVNPFAATQKVETINFKGCAVDFTYDTLTGAVVSAALNPNNAKPACIAGQNDGQCCAFNGGEDVSHLTLELNGEPLGAGQIGSGYVSTGDHSCTTRIIGGRVYTWGAPCP
jgi:hypothetical protein